MRFSSAPVVSNFFPWALRLRLICLATLAAAAGRDFPCVIWSCTNSCITPVEKSRLIRSSAVLFGRPAIGCTNRSSIIKASSFRCARVRGFAPRSRSRQKTASLIFITAYSSRCAPSFFLAHKKLPSRSYARLRRFSRNLQLETAMRTTEKFSREVLETDITASGAEGIEYLGLMNTLRSFTYLRHTASPETKAGDTKSSRSDTSAERFVSRLRDADFSKSRTRTYIAKEWSYSARTLPPSSSPVQLLKSMRLENVLLLAGLPPAFFFSCGCRRLGLRARAPAWGYPIPLKRQIGIGVS